MANEEHESATDKLTRNVSLPLRAVGGRVFVQNAQGDNTDLCTIEIKCWWSPSLLEMFDTDIRIGDDKHKPLKWDDDGLQVIDEDGEEEVGWSLLDCPIMLTLYRVDEEWLAESATKTDGKLILGRLNYYAPIQTADGVFSKKRPAITAWVGVGNGNFALLGDRLINTETPDFDLGISVNFPSGTVVTSWVDKKVNWDGKGPLFVSDATIVWKRGDWDSDADRQRHVSRKLEPEQHDLSRDDIELLGAVNRLEGAVVKLATPLWLALGAVIIAAILSR